MCEHVPYHWANYSIFIYLSYVLEDLIHSLNGQNKEINILQKRYVNNVLIYSKSHTK